MTNPEPNFNLIPQDSKDRYYQGVDGSLWKVNNLQVWFREKNLTWTLQPEDASFLMLTGISLDKIKEIKNPVSIEPWDSDNAK